MQRQSVSSYLFPSDGIKVGEPPKLTRPRLRQVKSKKVWLHQDIVGYREDQRLEKSTKNKVARHIEGLAARGEVLGRQKDLVGAGRGWLRAALGGAGGFQYYLWYAISGYGVGADIQLPEGEYLVREIRHHDLNDKALSVGNFPDDYLEWSPEFLQIGEKDTYNDYNDDQARIILSPNNFSVIKGYPGSGKTTTAMLALRHFEGRVLWVTHSEGLAAKCKAEADIGTPESSEVNIESFGTFLDQVEGVLRGSNRLLNQTDAADRLMELLDTSEKRFEQDVRNRDEVFAELHAYVFGRCLPFDLQTVKAEDSEMLTHDAYRKLRDGRIDDRLIERIRLICEYLRQNENQSALREIFTGPIKSRDLLADIGKSPPAQLESLGMVIVDEVQDFTASELLLLLNVIARSALKSGRLPRLIFAGDESQTVRPSGFDWAMLSALVHGVFGARYETVTDLDQDTSLRQNVRSTKEVSCFIEATRAAYRELEKNDRPSTPSYVGSDDSMEGRVLYGWYAPEELNQITEIIRGTPGNTCIYPGTRVPDDLSPDLRAKSALEVKGLDFQTVFVVDAGRILGEIQEKLRSARETQQFGVISRLRIDQFRVAVSRATERLVLLDRGESFESNVRDLLEAGKRYVEDRGETSDSTASLGDVKLEVRTVNGLQELLGKERDDFLVLEQLIEEARRDALDYPRRARQTLVSCDKQLELVRRQQPVAESVVERLNRTRAEVNFSYLISGEAPPSERGLLRQEIFQTITEPEYEPVILAMLHLADTKTIEPCNRETLESIDASLAGRVLIEEEFRDFRLRHSEQLTLWLNTVAQLKLGLDEKSQGFVHASEVVETSRRLVAVADEFSPENVSLVGQATTSILGWAEESYIRGRYELARQLLTVRENSILDAKCLFKLGRFDEAATAFEAGGDYENAVLAARQALNLERAELLAEKCSDETKRRVEQVRALLGVVDNTQADVRFTSAEVDRLRQLTLRPLTEDF
jgi:hypothetical protein